VSAAVLVHGADNFIGSRLVEALRKKDGIEVRAVAAEDESALRRALPGAQCVAHCILGAASRVERGGAMLYGLLAVASNAPKVVHLSSMTVYGSVTGAVDESCALRADLGPYSVAQARAEAFAANYSRAVILRSGVEYGPGCVTWSGRVARWLRAHRLGDLGEAGDGVCNLVYIDDLLSVMMSALGEQAVESGVFNVAAAHKPTWNEYFTDYAVALGATPVRRIGPRRLSLEAGIAAPLLKVAEVLAGAAGAGSRPVPPPIPPSLLRTCRQEIVLNVTHVEERLAARWTPLQEGLRRAANFFG
jgi:nucleoside-diphosphate-sugar epimerase